MRAPPRRSRTRRGGAVGRTSVSALLVAHVADVATQFPPVLTRLPLVAGEVAAVVPEVTGVALQLVAAREDTRGVARGPGVGDHGSIVPDLLPTTDNLALSLSDLVPVG